MCGTVFYSSVFCQCTAKRYPGMGYGLLPMMAGVAELAGRGITATIAAGKSSYIGTCLASPVAWIFASVLLWVMYFYVMKDMARKLYGTNKL